MTAAALAVALLAACGSPSPRLCAPTPVVAPIAPARPCMRPPPAAPEMTGDESIDRHRRDWHRDRLIAWSITAYEACRPVGAVAPVEGR